MVQGFHLGGVLVSRFCKLLGDLYPFVESLKLGFRIQVCLFCIKLLVSKFSFIDFRPTKLPNCLGDCVASLRLKGWVWRCTTKVP